MITTMITGAIGFIMIAIFSFLPVVTIADIPYIGSSVSGYLDTIMLTWNAFMVTFPYAETGWFVFKMLLWFEALLLLARFLLGSRTPVHNA